MHDSINSLSNLKRTDRIGFLAIMIILYAAWANCTGWLLSIFGALHSIGYLVASLPLWYTGFRFLREYRKQGFRFTGSFRSLRFNDYVWISLVFVILIGAVMNRPLGWDACAYRIPRVLRWLTENHWFWIQSGDDRQDISALAMEWMMAPQYAVFGTDRLLFLLNFLPYVCLPWLCWHVARHLGLKRDWSMIASFLIPMAHCYALSAGGVQNDGLGAFFGMLPLAMLHSTCCQWLKPKNKFYIGLVSLGLLSGIKLSNAPLAGMIGIYLIWNQRSQIIEILQPIRKVFITFLVTVTCSIIPISFINLHYTGGMSGDPENIYGHQAKSFLAGLMGNSLFLLSDGINPNPFSSQLNDLIKKNEFFAEKIARLELNYPNVKYFKFTTYGYDAGSGPSTPLLLSMPALLAFGLLFHRRRIPIELKCLLLPLLISSAYFVFMAKVGVHGSQRHAAPYYPPLVLAVLPFLTRSISLMPRWIVNVCILMTGVLVLINLILSPVRPIIPGSLAQILDRKGGAFELHRDMLRQGDILQGHEDRLILAALQWGAPMHQLWPPFFKGRVIEINSKEYHPSMKHGKGLIYITKTGVEKRFGMRYEDFLLVIGSHRVICLDKSAMGNFHAEAVHLIEVDDLSQLPESAKIRIYPHQ